MIIVGADYHPGFQQIAFVDTDTGEFEERRLEHREEAEEFYRDLGAPGLRVRVGMEASGHARWFERLLSELQSELWIGDAAEIRTKRVRKQNTDRQDAQLILRLMLEDRFRQIFGHDPQLQHLSIYRRRNRRMRGDKLTSTHFKHGHLKAVSFGKTMWPQFSQISRPLETTVIKWNSSSRTQ